MPTATGHTAAIRASKVIGTKVCDASGDHVGKIEDIILDKQSNAIMFAVVGFGGVLGVGEKYHPLPWAALDYVDDKKAYVVPYGEDQLKSAPSDKIDELTKNDGAAFRDRVYDHYKAERYWI
ncbi:MAG: PRC-barrel domain containing protein [Alphaproteobacteria bacterium]|nr:PRC-barrel domain containing protein [Alphaproteobacteria bacterium]